MNQNHITWCKTNHALIKEGGSWAVPRSGLIFKKTLVGYELTDLMPYTPELSQGFSDGKDVPPSPGKLLEYQRQDFNCIRQHHEAAGLTVTDPSRLLYGTNKYGEG